MALGTDASLLVRHPWSRPARLVERPGPQDAELRRLSPDERETFGRDGYLCLEKALDATTLERLAAELDPLEAAVAADLRRRRDGRFLIARADTIHFVYNPASQSPWLRRFVSGQPFEALAHDLLGPDVRIFWDQAVYKHAAAPRAFPCHQDNGYGFLEPESYLTCWVALSDSTVRNGCPRVFPGLHRGGTYRHRQLEDGLALPLDWRDGTPVEAPAGSILCFSSLLPHATGPNESGAVRKAYILQYTVEDAAYLRGDPEAGPPTEREAVRDLPDTRQWRIPVAT